MAQRANVLLMIACAMLPLLLLAGALLWQEERRLAGC
jgi:hypothetical protein